MYTRGSFIEDVVVDLESSHPDDVARMLAIASATIDIDEYGGGSFKGSRICYKPREKLKGLTHCFADHRTGGAETLAAFAIRTVDATIAVSQPLLHELPQTIMGISLRSQHPQLR